MHSKIVVQPILPVIMTLDPSVYRVAFGRPPRKLDPMLNLYVWCKKDNLFSLLTGFGSVKPGSYFRIIGSRGDCLWSFQLLDSTEIEGFHVFDLGTNHCRLGIRLFLLFECHVKHAPTLQFFVMVIIEGSVS